MNVVHEILPEIHVEEIIDVQYKIIQRVQNRAKIINPVKLYTALACPFLVPLRFSTQLSRKVQYLPPPPPQFHKTRSDGTLSRSPIEFYPRMISCWGSLETEEADKNSIQHNISPSWEQLALSLFYSRFLFLSLSPGWCDNQLLRVCSLLSCICSAIISAGKWIYFLLVWRIFLPVGRRYFLPAWRIFPPSWKSISSPLEECISEVQDPSRMIFKVYSTLNFLEPKKHCLAPLCKRLFNAQISYWSFLQMLNYQYLQCSTHWSLYEIWALHKNHWKNVGFWSWSY